jgi:hypothetical protein
MNLCWRYRFSGLGGGRQVDRTTTSAKTPVSQRKLRDPNGRDLLNHELLILRKRCFRLGFLLQAQKPPSIWHAHPPQSMLEHLNFPRFIQNQLLNRPYLVRWQTRKYL